jgi:hypothetical protein
MKFVIMYKYFPNVLVFCLFLSLCLSTVSSPNCLVTNMNLSYQSNFSHSVSKISYFYSGRLDIFGISSFKCLYLYTRWFKCDRDYLCVNKSQFVPVIFEPPCTCVSSNNYAFSRHLHISCKI